MHSGQKCIEYYFDNNMDKDSIYNEVQKNVNELKKISKIKDVEIKIEQNEWGVNIAKVNIMQKPSYLKRMFQTFENRKNVDKKDKIIKEKNKKEKSISKSVREINIDFKKYIENKSFGKYKETSKVYKPI